MPYNNTMLTKLSGIGVMSRPGPWHGSGLQQQHSSRLLQHRNRTTTTHITARHTFQTFLHSKLRCLVLRTCCGCLFDRFLQPKKTRPAPWIWRRRCQLHATGETCPAKPATQPQSQVDGVR
jgi:hypothetical protein